MLTVGRFVNNDRLAAVALDVYTAARVFPVQDTQLPPEFGRVSTRFYFHIRSASKGTLIPVSLPSNENGLQCLFRTGIRAAQRCETRLVNVFRSRLFRLCILCVIAANFSHALFGSKTRAAEQAGAYLFHDKVCAYCHGATGAGTAKGPSLDSIRKTWKPAQIADQIENGGQKMPAFKDSLSNEQVAQLVTWLRAKHRPVPTADPNETTVSNPAQ